MRLLAVGREPRPVGVFTRQPLALGVGLLLFLLVGCQSGVRPGRTFRFSSDTLAVTNETWWSYATDPVSGRLVHQTRQPEPTYALRCFVLARTAKQFHEHAEFQAGQSPLDPAAERARLRTLLRRSPRRRGELEPPVVFPGYADLRAFSDARADWIRADAGGAWRSYLQRGNWRMVLPFSRQGQLREARRLADHVRAGHVAVLHMTEFPRLRVNHAVLLYAVSDGAGGTLDFSAYDPNDPGAPVVLQFRPADGHWWLPPVSYFPGGPVKAYEVYRSLFR